MSENILTTLVNCIILNEGTRLDNHNPPFTCYVIWKLWWRNIEKYVNCQVALAAAALWQGTMDQALRKVFDQTTHRHCSAAPAQWWWHGTILSLNQEHSVKNFPADFLPHSISIVQPTVITAMEEPIQENYEEEEDWPTKPNPCTVLADRK